jgi:hypothetical protein
MKNNRSSPQLFLAATPAALLTPASSASIHPASIFDSMAVKAAASRQLRVSNIAPEAKVGKCQFRSVL